MKSLFLVLVFLCSLFVNAQAGMTVSPGKLFFFGNEGNTVPQKIRIINPTERELEVGVSINDWRYDFAGGNEIAAFNSLPESAASWRSEEHTSELQSRENLVCRLLLEKKYISSREGY